MPTVDSESTVSQAMVGKTISRSKLRIPFPSGELRDETHWLFDCRWTPLHKHAYQRGSGGAAPPIDSAHCEAG